MKAEQLRSFRAAVRARLEWLKARGIAADTTTHPIMLQTYDQCCEAFGEDPFEGCHRIWDAIVRWSKQP